jgi:hypothetical protein
MPSPSNIAHSILELSLARILIDRGLDEDFAEAIAAAILSGGDEFDELIGSMTHIDTLQYIANALMAMTTLPIGPRFTARYERVKARLDALRQASEKIIPTPLTWAQELVEGLNTEQREELLEAIKGVS